ncbi:MAG: pyrroline-5-carboxylate reductase [Thermodesulfobacteriota bacterium]
MKESLDMVNDRRICLLGSGNMGEALVKGLVSTGTSKPENIVCTDKRESRLKMMAERYGVRTTPSNIEAVQASDIIIYAVKPQILAKVLKETAQHLDTSKLIVSIAAGVPLAAIESCLQKDLRLIRVMPNVPVAVQAGATAIAPGKHVLEGDVEAAKSIFDSVGETVVIEENILMDAITGLSGSGPAYIFLIIDALADAGVKMGLPRYDALFLATQTVLGAAKLLKETQMHPGAAKDMVTSPGGTAIAGIHTLEEGGLRTTLINAVQAATQRSRELGAQLIKDFQENNNNY